MIALFKRAHPWPGRGAAGASPELRELRHRVARLRRDVQALQARADALYGPDGSDGWRDPEAVPRG